MDEYANGRERVHAVGKAAEVAEKRKYTKYSCFEATNAIFLPLAVETGGLWPATTRKVFKNLIDRLQKKDGTPKHLLVAKWRAKICFAQFKTAARGLKIRSDAEDIRGQSVRDAEKAFDWQMFERCKT